MFGKRDVIVIGASAGGVEALRVIVGGLPRDLAAAVLVVMHQGSQGPYMMPRILNMLGTMRAVQPVDEMPIENGTIYVAPPDLHLVVKDTRLRLIRGPKENRARPAIDPLFRSAAVAYGSRVIGVILTGMLDDGTAGLAVVRECGGTTVVQDPADAEYPSMPSSALRYVKVDHTRMLSEIAPLLERLVSEPVDVPAPFPSRGSMTPNSGLLQWRR